MDILEYMSAKSEDEKVVHPKHYNAEGRMECIQEMELMFGLDAVETFCKLNAYKYYYRAGNKTGASKEEDEAKAQWYLNYAAGLRM